MNKRLREIVNYKTKGNSKQFAEIVGWKPQYLAKLLHGDDFGLKPVLAVLSALPEINARWFLLGQGEMLLEGRVEDLHQGTISHIQALLDLERFLPVMLPEQLERYSRMIAGHIDYPFSSDERAELIEKLVDRRNKLNRRVDQALERSDELCRQKTARK
jgi:hypothetical protein